MFKRLLTVWPCYTFDWHSPDHAWQHDINGYHATCDSCGLPLHLDRCGHWTSDATLTSSSIAKTIILLGVTIFIATLITEEFTVL